MEEKLKKVLSLLLVLAFFFGTVPVYAAADILNGNGNESGIANNAANDMVTLTTNRNGLAGYSHSACYEGCCGTIFNNSSPRGSHSNTMKSLDYLVNGSFLFDTDDAAATYDNEIDLPAIGTTTSISCTVTIGKTLTFSNSTLSTLYNLNDGTLKGIRFTPKTANYGIWYNDGNVMTVGTAVDLSDISSLKYVAGTTANCSDAFSYTIANETGYSNDTATGIITVQPAAVSSISYSTQGDMAKLFDGADFNTICSNAGYGTLNYITISELPSSSKGTLYYNYTSSTSKTALSIDRTLFYSGSIQNLDKVAFVPITNYSGTFTLSYTGYNTGGSTYSGSIVITVTAADVGDVEYSVGAGEAVVFEADDFNAVCRSGGYETLSYITIDTIPASANGTLCYGYTSSGSGTALSSTSTKIYYGTDNTPYLDSLAFKANSSYIGTISIPYTGVDKVGNEFSGLIKISKAVNTITYTGSENNCVQFDGGDFNDACKDDGFKTLDYIKISSLPTSNNGVLYYNYSSSTDSGTNVTTSTKLYYADSPNLDNVVFVPDDDYTGTFTVSYTGYDTDGSEICGTIEITISGAITAKTITYSTTQASPITLKASDFYEKCQNATSGTLSYIVFTSSITNKYGHMNLNYVSSSAPGTAVSAGKKYYYSSDSYNISNITFIPEASGIVTINYKGYTSGSTVYEGAVTINITEVKTEASKYFKDVTSSYSWASSQIDYLYEKGVVAGTGASQYSPASSLKRGDFILMLYRALGFTASSSDNFTDVVKGSYYYDAIAAAKALGIAKGTDNNFNPEEYVTRQDAIVLVYRALEAVNKSVASGTSSDLSAFADKGNVSDYAITAVSSLVKAGIVTGSGSGINPLNNITRAEMAVILYRVINS